jgi:hypothetical protein
MMIFTRRFGALAARPQFPDAPELQQELDLDVELARLTGEARLDEARLTDERRRQADETAA